jgi:hypothetical protein
VVAGQVSVLCASWAARISGWLRDLISSLRNLLRESGRLGELIDALRKRLRGQDSKEPDVPETPLDPPKTREPPKKIGGPKQFDPEELCGLTPDEIKQRIPDDWEPRPSSKGGGIVYADPANNGRQIRLMPGYPPHSRPDPLTWGPYAEVSQNGVTKKVPLFGNPKLEGPQ